MKAKTGVKCVDDALDESRRSPTLDLILFVALVICAVCLLMA